LDVLLHHQFTPGHFAPKMLRLSMYSTFPAYSVKDQAPGIEMSRGRTEEGRNVHKSYEMQLNIKSNLCRHSLVVIVFLSMSRQIGHINSLCKLRGDTAISVLSVITSWGVLCSSYKLNSHVLFDNGACSITEDYEFRINFARYRQNKEFFSHKIHIKNAESTISGSGKRRSKTRSTVENYYNIT